jgi:hypothetical protein
MYPTEDSPQNFHNLYVPSKICQKPYEPSPWIFKPCASMNCYSPPVQVWSEVVCHVPDSVALAEDVGEGVADHLVGAKTQVSHCGNRIRQWQSRHLKKAKLFTVLLGNDHQVKFQEIESYFCQEIEIRSPDHCIFHEIESQK